MMLTVKERGNEGILSFRALKISDATPPRLKYLICFKSLQSTNNIIHGWSIYSHLPEKKLFTFFFLFSLKTSPPKFFLYKKIKRKRRKAPLTVHFPFFYLLSSANVQKKTGNFLRAFRTSYVFKWAFEVEELFIIGCAWQNGNAYQIELS